MHSLQLQLAPIPSHWHDAVDLLDLDWSVLPRLPALRHYHGRSPAQHQTVVRAGADQQALAVHFQCTDPDIWATMSKRDQPIYEEEVVELFLSPGPDTPTDYFEFEINPDGVLFDARIHNPGQHGPIIVDHGWDCPGIRWAAARHDAINQWEACLYLPWAGLLGSAPPPHLWRGNFYRIERPREAAPEFSCWSPTLVEPANFHIPAHFGTLIRPD